jgi:hypothetical protein
MRQYSIWSMIFLFVACTGGCASSKGNRPIAGNQDSGPEVAPTSQRTESGGRTSTGGTAKPVRYTEENNPTTKAGRGTPGLEDFLAPAAWVLIDGQEGRFIERDGQRIAQWVLEATVSESPSFQVAVLESLLGKPTEFACTLDTIETNDGSAIQYAIKANEGAFSVGRSYSLLRPGSDFVVRNRLTGDVVNEIAPLSPGTYLLAVKIANAGTGKEALAISQFTVR